MTYSADHLSLNLAVWVWEWCKCHYVFSLISAVHQFQIILFCSYSSPWLKLSLGLWFHFSGHLRSQLDCKGNVGEFELVKFCTTQKHSKSLFLFCFLCTCCRLSVAKIYFVKCYTKFCVLHFKLWEWCWEYIVVLFQPRTK